MKATARPKKKETAEVVARQIERHFRQQILNGTLAAGERLPTNRALAAEWATSCNTVQSALANLAAAGLIERATARGSFVRGQQNRANVGILVGPSLTANSSWFYRNLVEALQNEIETEHVSSRVYAGLSFGDSPILKALHQDEKHLSFMGFIEIATARCADQLPIGNTPTVVLDARRPENCLQFDWTDCSKRIAFSLKEQKIGSAWIVSARTTEAAAIESSYLQEALLKHHPIPHETVEVVYDALSNSIDSAGYQLWIDRFSGGGVNHLPEAIVVSNDALLSSLLYALLKYDVEVPRRVKIFVITTKKSELFSPVPIAQFVFPIQKTAHYLTHLLRERIRGNKTPSDLLLMKGEFLTNY